MTVAVLFFKETSASGTGVWPHYCSICEGHQIRLLSVPVSGTSTEKAVTRTHPASAVSRDLGPIKYTPPGVDYLQQRQNVPISVRQHWQLLWEGPIEINRGYSHTPLFSQPSSPLPPKTHGDSFRAPCGWRRTVTLQGGRLDKKNAAT